MALAIRFETMTQGQMKYQNNQNISVVTVNYNNGDALDKTMQSVLDQDVSNFEYIVIDGGSTDNSLEVIHKYASKLAYWVSEKDGGIYAAMNKAIRVASGDYVLFLNSGDVFYDANALKSIRPFLTTDFVCGNACLTYGESESTSFWIAPKSVDRLYFEQRLSLCHQSLFIRTTLLKERAYDDSFKIVADYEQLFYEIVVNHRTYQNADLTICYYGCDGISSDHDKSDREKRAVLEKFRENGYIQQDELLTLVNALKVGTRKYKLSLFFVKMITNGTNILRQWISQ